ncbi:Alpha/Beta hydrolase protein [Scheffersomyces coipomensis]|uniref:Alpha/Beta hydrolase protein n=1 Tax=Scheffersomyces coipomensis TaxID=1788519 RepID=UPI00315D798A
MINIGKHRISSLSYTFRGTIQHVRSYSKIDLNELHTKQIPSHKRIRRDPIIDLPKHDTVELSCRQYKPSKSFEADPNLEPIVMLHGFLGSKQNFGTVGNKITKLTHHPAFGVDLRNHGDTPHASPHDYGHLAQDVIRFLSEKNWKDVILMGHSMGAKTAMMVALLRPDLVSKLIVIDNSPVSSELDDSFRQHLYGMCEVEHEFPEFKDYKPALQTSVIDNILNQYTEKDQKINFFLKSNIDKKHSNTRGSLFRVPVLNLIKENVIEKMGQWPLEQVSGLKFTKPVLVMAAKHSNFVQPQYKPLFEEYFTDLTYHEFDCGHWIVTDKPDEFIKETVNFIDH